MAGCTIRARASVPITVTVHVSSCNFALPYSKKEDDEVAIERPKIHESEFRRIRNQSHALRPIGLPAVYDIVRPTVRLYAGSIWVRDRRCGQDAADAQEHVWNEIWKRRVVYFATVGATAWLLAFPLISGATRSDEFTSPIRWVSDIIRFVGAFLPGFASTWVDGYARAPFSFLLLPAWTRSSICGECASIPHRRPHGRRSGEERLPRRRACPMISSTGFAAVNFTLHCMRE